MNLNKQVYLYSVDTSTFYNEEELKVHNKMNEVALEKNKLHKELNKLENDELTDAKEKMKQYTADYKEYKNNIYELFKKHEGTRKLNPIFLKKSNIVAMFDGNTTRTFGIEQNQLTEDIFIVRAYFFDVVRDIIQNGFYHNGEKYIYFTSSAGQIRTKKTVFIKESLWKEHGKSLMCGLDIDEINNRGGINENKFLAYLALSNGATEIFESFDITKSIVVEDFETMVNGEVDYIDPKTYSIERKFMDVPITHTDGCGMILPKVNTKNFMVRCPWIKGLLSPFAFDEFCRENEHSGDVVDIYGKKYNIFKDEIEVIFTKSQFKMWKYYDSWQDYIDKYVENNCLANMCNEDEDYIRNAKFNYQMLQTLSDITDSELDIITKDARREIEKIATDKKTMLKIFGAVNYNKNKNYLQEALEIYPELLSDSYCKEILKMIKRKMVKNARFAKFEVNGKFTFIIPDLYAFCTNLFLGLKNPKGLLADNEVCCRLYERSEELDCLRSPHLYREHAVRKNVLDEKKKKWFITNGLYTSCHDLMSKLLQFDVDGDKALVCACKTIIEVAKRNMDGIVPMYYEMGSAKPAIIDNQKIYEGLVFAFANCNIGATSNDITKVWNSDDINLDIIKFLCMETNFLIDAAKTLTKLKRPKEMHGLISQYTKRKVPHFFIYAKDKKEHQVEKLNKSIINRLEALFPNKRITFDKQAFRKFDYRMLMQNPDVEVDDSVIKKYEELKMHNRFNLKKEDMEKTNIEYIYQEKRKELLLLCDDAYVLSDMLVKYLYSIKKTAQKEALWYSFGDVLLENLKCNLEERFGNDYILCEECEAERIKKGNNRHKYCDKCWAEINKEQTKDRVKKHRELQNVTL